jgi:hypothetical protein
VFDVRLTVVISAIVSGALYLGWLPAGDMDAYAPMALATAALLTISTIYGLAR